MAHLQIVVATTTFIVYTDATGKWDKVKRISQQYQKHQVKRD